MPSAIAPRPNETKLIHSVVGKMVMLVIKAVWQEDALGHVRAGGECACFHQAWHCLHRSRVEQPCTGVLQSYGAEQLPGHIHEHYYNQARL